MIDHRLKSISASAMAVLPEGSHLDEDTISAFVEGRLGKVESRPVLSHLTACSTCRRASADLVRLENQIDAASEPMPEPDEPGRLQAFLSNLQSLVPDGGDEVVFAYQNPEGEDEPNKPTAESGSSEKKD